MARLPTRSRLSPTEGRTRVQRLPGPQDVPRANLASDPGLRVPRDDFSQGIEELGRGISGFGDELDVAADREQKLRDFTLTNKALQAFDLETSQEFQRRQTEGNPAQQGFADDFHGFAKGRIDDHINALGDGVSEEAKERLRVQLGARAVSWKQSARQTHFKAAADEANDTWRSRVNELSAQAAQYPESLNQLLAEGERELSGLAGVLDEDAERESRLRLQQNLVQAAIEGKLAVADYDGARSLLGGNSLQGGGFDPDGAGFDMDRARAAGMTPAGPEAGENEGHFGSVVPVNESERRQLGFDGEAYIILKGRDHETFDKAVAAEKRRGFKIVKAGGRYYSVPGDADIDSTGRSGDEGLDEVFDAKTRRALEGRIDTVQLRDERLRISSIDRAERKQKEAAKELSDSLTKQGIALAASDQLSEEWVLQRQDVLDQSDFQTLMKAAGTDSVEDDRVVVADLYEKMSAGEDVERMAIEAFSNGELRRETMNTIVSRSQSLREKGGSRTPFQRASSFLRNALRPSELNDNPDAAAAYANAEADLMAFFDNNPQASVNEAMTRARELSDSYRLVPGTALSMPFPDWMLGDRMAKAPDLEATEEKIIRDLSSGRITSEEAQRRAGVINRWREYFEMRPQ